MKTKHLVGIIVMAVAMGVLISMATSFSTYSTFSDAAKKPDKKVQIVGYLVQDQPIEYNPEVDANKLTFFMKDKNDEVRQVVYLQGKPQDFERSEEIVLTGKLQGEQFVASDMLLKCPSKYTEEEIQLKDKTSMNNY